MRAASLPLDTPGDWPARPPEAREKPSASGLLDPLLLSVPSPGPATATVRRTGCRCTVRLPPPRHGGRGGGHRATRRSTTHCSRLRARIGGIPGERACAFSRLAPHRPLTPSRTRWSTPVRGTRRSGDRGSPVERARTRAESVRSTFLLTLRNRMRNTTWSFTAPDRRTTPIAATMRLRKHGS